MNLRLSELEAHAIRALLAERALAMRSHPGAGFVAENLADFYDELRCHLESATVRRDGTLGVTLTRRGSERLEAALAHDGRPVFVPVLRKISQARLPKGDPRRPNGRRVPEGASA